VVQTGSTILRSECSETRSVFALTIAPNVSTAAKTSAMIFREREAIVPPSPCWRNGPGLIAGARVASAQRVVLRLALLLDVPEHRYRRGRNTIDVLAHCGRQIVLPEEKMRGH